MAEEEPVLQGNGEDNKSQGGQVRQKRQEGQEYTEKDYDNTKCNLRIEEMAKPNRMHVKLIYHDYKQLLPDRNVRAVLLFLREEFAKSPEETELDFNKLEHQYKVKKCRKLCKTDARKQHMVKINENKRKNMLNILTDILRRHIARAYFNPKQIIMTTRLRKISNTILKELCRIKGIQVPRRESTNIRALLMFSTADYFAYCIDMIYYELQVQKVTDYEKLQQQKAIQSSASEKI